MDNFQLLDQEHARRAKADRIMLRHAQLGVLLIAAGLHDAVAVRQLNHLGATIDAHLDGTAGDQAEPAGC